MSRFAILTSQRSGSVWLESSLSSHPDIHCFGELLLGIGTENDAPVPSLLRRQRQLRHVYSAARSGALFRPFGTIRSTFARRSEVAVGCRIMAGHARGRTLEQLAGYLDAVIYLHREDQLRQFVSLQIMRDRQRSLGMGSAHTTSGAFTESISFDIDAFESWRSELDAEFSRAERHLADLPALRLTYESLGTNGQLSDETTKQICALLGVDAAPLASPYRPSGSRPLSDMIDNYDAIAGYLSTTGLIGEL